MLIAQISDTHITDNDGFMERTYGTAACLSRAVEHLNRLSLPPDLVMVSGDCGGSGTDSQYDRFQKLLRPLAMPVYVIPGNHDDRARMRDISGPQGSQAMDGFVQYVVDAGPLRLIALDTNIPGGPGGKLFARRLDCLEARLSEARDQPTAIFLHHPPFASGFTVMDEMGLADAEGFGAIAASCPSTATQIHLDFARTDRLSVVQSAPTCCKAGTRRPGS